MTDAFELADWEGLPRVLGNVAFRKLHFKKGQVLPPHKHNFAHAHRVAFGSIRCKLWDGDTVVSDTLYHAGDWFDVPAKLGHQLIAETEIAVGECIFAVRNEDGGVAYEVTDAHRKDNFWHERIGRGDNV